VKFLNTNGIKIAKYLISIAGILFIAVSIFYASSFFAILGTALLSWGVLLIYVTPTKHVPLTLLEGMILSSSSNIERILINCNLYEKGKYLPPRYLKDIESSLVFVPAYSKQPLPKPEEVIEEKLLLEDRKLIFVTPPGFGLCKLFEKVIKVSFSKKDLDFVEKRLPRLLVEDMELAERVELKKQNDSITLKIKGNLFGEICNNEITKFPRTHNQVGCIVSSAIACVLAKASGQIVTIQNDSQCDDGKTSMIEFHLESEKNF
jgi:hypothetical protein